MLAAYATIKLQSFMRSWLTLSAAQADHKHVLYNQVEGARGTLWSKPLNSTYQIETGTRRRFILCEMTDYDTARRRPYLHLMPSAHP